MTEEIKTYRYWLAFDLPSSCRELYEWLDDIGAQECGDSLATFKTAMQPDEVKTHIAMIGERIGNRDRLYLIGPKDDGLLGAFVIGHRKAPIWTGFGRPPFADEVDEG